MAAPAGAAAPPAAPLPAARLPYGQAKGNLANFTLPCGMSAFLRLFWEAQPQHVDFLTTKLNETGIVMTPWEPKTAGADVSAGAVALGRSVSVLHPLPIQLPWLPLHIQNRCDQRVSYNVKTQPHQLTIVERSAVNGIPFVQPYVICTWTIMERQGDDDDTAVNGGGGGGGSGATDEPWLSVSCNLQFEYDAFTLLQSQVEFWATSAMEIYFREWVPHAQAILAGLCTGGDEGGRAEDAAGELLQAFWPRGAPKSTWAPDHPPRIEPGAGAGAGARPGAGGDDGDTWRVAGGVGGGEEDDADDQGRLGQKNEANESKEEVEEAKEQEGEAGDDDSGLRRSGGGAAGAPSTGLVGLAHKLLSALGSGAGTAQASVPPSSAAAAATPVSSPTPPRDQETPLPPPSAPAVAETAEELALRRVTEDARKLSAQRPFKGGSVLGTVTAERGDPVTGVWTAGGGAAGASRGGSRSAEAGERRREAKRQNAHVRKAHTPEASVPPGVAAPFSCAIDFEKLFSLPRRPTIAAAPPPAAAAAPPPARVPGGPASAANSPMSPL